MAVQRSWLGFWLLCLGCQAMPPCEEQQSKASRYWQMGQAAMREGRTEEAIDCYERSLAADADLTRNHLSLAAAYLEENDRDSACAHLASYVHGNPEKLLIRVHYAELLLQLRRLHEARVEFEQLVFNSQKKSGATSPDLIHCHSRLVEIAEASDDVYNEHLHRGIGLYLLARKRSSLPDPDDDLPAESLLCKAAAELTLAQVQEPEEARPLWYLYQVWSRLGQRQPALCRLREANAAAPFTFLTPTEECALHLAWQRYLAEAERR
jgi:tetratricopeptide (TPR) repeat protein